MCHERLSRREERAEDVRGRRLWDLFYSETERQAPPVPMAEQEKEREPEREEALTGAAQRTDR